MSEIATAPEGIKTKKKRPYYLCRVMENGDLRRETSVEDTKAGLKAVKDKAREGDMGPFIVISQATDELKPKVETVVYF